MSNKGRRRSREEFEASSVSIDEALKQIYDNDEVMEPTKKKVRRQLQSKLNCSKSYIKQNKQLINTLIQKYWISPPQQVINTNTNNSNNNHNNNHQDNNDTKPKMTILSIPDEVQQYIFTMLHPKEMYFALPIACKWWYHLLNKESFLTSLCLHILKLESCKIPTPLQLNKISDFLKKCCLNCSNYKTFQNQFNPSKDGTENSVCWIYPICEICYDINANLQGIYWMHARRKYKLSDYDLWCCKSKKIGRTYLLHSDVINVAKDKYGDISMINTLSSLEIAAINSQRKRCYNKKCKELKKELKEWLYQTELNSDKLEKEENEVKEWKDINLDKNEIKSELKEFFKEHHDGYEFYSGAHCNPTVDNFGRKYMDLKIDMVEIKRMLNECINKKKERKYRIRNMSKKEMYNDFYENSWMDDRFGSGYGNYM